MGRIVCKYIASLLPMHIVDNYVVHLFFHSINTVTNIPINTAIMSITTTTTRMTCTGRDESEKWTIVQL